MESPNKLRALVRSNRYFLNAIAPSGWQWLSEDVMTLVASYVNDSSLARWSECSRWWAAFLHDLRWYWVEAPPQRCLKDYHLSKLSRLKYLCKLRCHVDGQHFETPQGQHFFRFVWGRFKSLKWLSLKVSHFDHDHVASLQTVAPAMSSLNLSVDVAHFTTSPNNSPHGSPDAKPGFKSATHDSEQRDGHAKTAAERKRGDATPHPTLLHSSPSSSSVATASVTAALVDPHEQERISEALAGLLQKTVFLSSLILAGNQHVVSSHMFRHKCMEGLKKVDLSFCDVVFLPTHLSHQNGVVVDDECIECIATHCPLLEWLSLAQCNNLTESGIGTLGCSRRLQHLDLSSCQYVHAKVIPRLLSDCKLLVSVALNESLSFSDTVLRDIHTSTLVHLSLNKVGMSDMAMSSFLKNCGSRLSTLSASCTALGDLSCESLGAHCTRLQKLDIRKTGVTAAGLSHLTNCRFLRVVILTGCLLDSGEESDARALRNFQTAVPSCRIVTPSGRDINPKTSRYVRSNTVDNLHTAST